MRHAEQPTTGEISREILDELEAELRQTEASNRALVEEMSRNSDRLKVLRETLREIRIRKSRDLIPTAEESNLH